MQKNLEGALYNRQGILDMNNFNTPKETAELTINAGVTKAALPIYKMLLLGFIAGMFISLGATGYLTVSANIIGELSGLGKLLGAMIFPVGLMLVVVCGAELFTGNCLMSLAAFAKKITPYRLIRSWVFVYIGNALGAYFSAVLLYYSGSFPVGVMADNIVKIAQAKAMLPFMNVFLKGILCNILVCLGVWFATASRDVAGKCIACFFPITTFVICGYEHCVANMFYFPLGQLCGADVSTFDAWFNNIFPSTLGNIVGGCLVAFVYYICYIREDKQKSI